MGKDSCAFHMSGGRKLDSVPMWSRIAMYLGGKKIQILPHVGMNLWESLAMHLDVKKKLESSTMWRRISGKDSHAYRKKP